MMIGTQWVPHFPPEILAQVGGQDVPSGYRDEMLRGRAPGYQYQMDWISIPLGFADGIHSLNGKSTTWGIFLWEYVVFVFVFWGS